MVEAGEDDTFLKEFIARAARRQKRLDIEDIKMADERAEVGQAEVSYPALSPLPEETESMATTNQPDEISIGTFDDREENMPPESELNYSSDLSLDCDGSDDVYRAQPVVCNSSPEHLPSSQESTPRYSQSHRVSPRKQQHLPQIAPIHIEQPVPLQERHQTEQKPTSSHSLPEVSSNEQKEKDILVMKQRAEQAKQQLKKAVEVSKYGSEEHIMAARLLQVAEIEYVNYTSQLAMFKEGNRRQRESLGSIKLSDLKLKIGSKLRNDLAEDGVSHHFFGVATCGLEVKATGIVDTNAIRRQDLKSYLQFKETISFADLPPDFMVKFEVYELVIGQNLPKLLSRLTPSKKTKYTPESHFKRVGSLKLTLTDRDLTSKSLTQWSKHEESKYIERELKFKMELRPEQLPRKAGMLHVRCFDNAGHPDWSRFWVDLSGGNIRFWKSKLDALDGKKPNQILEFNDICSESVYKLTPDNDLYRQNSFVLYSFQLIVGGERDNLLQRVLKDDPKFKILKHQLAAENKEDRDAWCSTMDRSMHCYREWYGKTKLYSREELDRLFST